MTSDRDPGAPRGERSAEFPLPDFEALSANMARLIEASGKATAAYLKPIEERRGSEGGGEEAAEVVKTLGQVAERWFTDPAKAFEAQSKLATGFVELWGTTLKRMQGEDVEPVAAPDAKDKRFADPSWEQIPFFDFLKQAYLLTSGWAEHLVENAEGLDEHTRLKARFYVKQLSGALSPSNFLVTNPELIRETVKENGANLVRGMKMLAEDVEAGHGELKVRQTDASKFALGVNVATTPGKIVFRNDVIELIQYTPATETVLKRPLLIVPPWINKYYILDLNEQKSFIGWAVAQGVTVFVVSWVNPDERHAEMGWDAYMKEGILAAVDAVERATGEQRMASVGYCVGGTLLALTLAYMAQTGDARIDSCTFLTAQVDFSEAGDLKAFVDEEQLKGVEAMMRGRGFLEGSRMATAFNMLRPNDLIWPYFINVYLKGKDPFPFDLLYWNSDSTRLTAANHRFYLRSCYLENRLVNGAVELGGVKLELKNVTIPIYNLATREDHIAPARSVLKGSSAFGGPVKLVIAGSGHIAGVVNPPSMKKYQFWEGPEPRGTLEQWIAQAREVPGSWWPNWFEWLEAQAPERIPAEARMPGAGALEALCDAPGEYVKIKV